MIDCLADINTEETCVSLPETRSRSSKHWHAGRNKQKYDKTNFWKQMLALFVDIVILILVSSDRDMTVPCLDGSNILDTKRRLKCPSNFRSPSWILV